MSEKLTAEEARNLLDYNPETGVLTWRARTPDMFTSTRRFSAEVRCRNWNNRFAGKQAGTKSDSDYSKVRIFGRNYQAHRVAYLLMTGGWPIYYVDHRNNGICTNNWDNLRVATHSQNMWNSKRRIDNTSGFKGVSFDKPLRKWRAQIYINSKQIYLGLFNTPEEAHEAYVAAAKHYFGEFARAS